MELRDILPSRDWLKAPQSRETQPSTPKRETSRTPTYDEANLTGGLLISTGHHGAHRVVDHSHHIQVEFLREERTQL